MAVVKYSDCCQWQWLMIMMMKTSDRKLQRLLFSDVECCFWQQHYDRCFQLWLLLSCKYMKCASTAIRDRQQCCHQLRCWMCCVAVALPSPLTQSLMRGGYQNLPQHRGRYLLFLYCSFLQVCSTNIYFTCQLDVFLCRWGRRGWGVWGRQAGQSVWTSSSEIAWYPGNLWVSGTTG